MKKPVRKEDPIMLIAAGVVALGVGGWVVSSALSLKGSVAEYEIPDVTTLIGGVTPEQVTLADTKNVSKQVAGASSFQVWKNYEAAGRSRGFMVSTPLVLKVDGSDRSIVDLDKADPALHPPMTNAYLTRYRLDIEKSNVGNLDPDGDYFTNEEEYLWGRAMGKEFDPTNGESHPPYYYKLVFDRLLNDAYPVAFNAIGDTDWQLKHPNKTDRKDRWTEYLGPDLIGKRIPNERKKHPQRFSLEKVEPGPPQVAVVVDHSRQPDHPKHTQRIPANGVVDFGDISGLFGFVKSPDQAVKLELLQKSGDLPDGLDGYSLRLLKVTDVVATVEVKEKSTGKTSTIEYPKGSALKPQQN